jgi:transcriptional regulator with XRE-family HTH domain
VRRKDWPDALIAAICRAIKERRLALDISIYALSQKSGVSQQAISYYEREMRRPTLEGLAKVATGLDWELSELISAAEDFLKRGRR